MMTTQTLTDHPDYPFAHYYSELSHYNEAQKYWLAVVRAVPGFDASEWQPTPKRVDLKDDMYLGLVVDIERLADHKAIQIYTTSLEGRANFLLQEDLETVQALAKHPMESEDAAARERMIQSGQLRAPFTSIEQATAEAHRELTHSHGFEVSVGTRGYFIENATNPSDGNIIDGEELSIISTVQPDNKKKAIQAIELFIASGLATARIQDAFPEGTLE